jgi:hypothetical protein
VNWKLSLVMAVWCLVGLLRFAWAFGRTNLHSSEADDIEAKKAIRSFSTSVLLMVCLFEMFCWPIELLIGLQRAWSHKRAAKASSEDINPSLIKRLLRRCREAGCWRHGLPCGEIDFNDLTARAKHWRTCEHHLDLERLAELERQKNDPKVIMSGDRVRALKCSKVEECGEHGNHEGTLVSTTYSPDADLSRPPWEPAKLGDLIYHINSDQGVHYHAIEIVKLVRGIDPQKG